MSALRQEDLDDRRELRWPCWLSVTVRTTDLTKRPAALVELSQRGCRLEMSTPSRAGDTLLLLINGMQPLSATLVWNDGHYCGLSFQHPLHIAVVDHLVRQNPARA